MVRNQALNLASLNAPAATRRALLEPSASSVPTTAFLPSSGYGQPGTQQQRLHAQGQQQQMQWKQQQPPGTPHLSGRPPPLEQQHLQGQALSHQQKVKQHKTLTQTPNPRL